MADEPLNTVKAALVDVVIKRGDTTIFAIPLYDPNDGNNPVDLTVYTSFKAQVKVDAQRSTSLIELTSGDAEIVVQGASNHELKFTISAAKSAVKLGTYVWDVEAVGGVEDPKTIIEGEFTISQDVTR